MNQALSTSKYAYIVQELVALYEIEKIDSAHGNLSADEIKSEMLVLEDEKKEFISLGLKYSEVVAAWPEGRISLAPFQYNGYEWEFSRKESCRVSSNSRVYDFQKGRLCYSGHTLSPHDFWCYYYVSGCDSILAMRFSGEEVSIMITENDDVPIWSARYRLDRAPRKDVILAQPKNIYRNFACGQE